MSSRRSLILLALVISAVAAASSCSDPSPIGVGLGPSMQKGGKWVTTSTSTGSTAPSGLVKCPQTYDSVSQVIGPEGGYIQVGAHILIVDSLVLTDTVTITAVAPADTVRWVRFQPTGLLFPPNLIDRLPTGELMPTGAVVATGYKDCAQLTGTINDSLRIAQVDDSLHILAYLTTYVHSKNIAGSQGQQYVWALLPHFSGYAMSW